MCYEHLTLEGFKQEIKDASTGHHPRKFCFVLGAGASKTSGIPSGQDLVRRWDAELNIRNPETHKKWRIELGITEKNMSSFYSQYYERRFSKQPSDGYNHLEKLMDNAKPSLGYVMLAHLLTNTYNNVVITTNFDHLIEDAVNYYTHKIPLVIGHESLAHYVTKNITRPTIIKIHRDLLLDPKNTTHEVELLHENWQTALEKIFSEYHPIFIGYAGNDNSLMDFLISRSNSFAAHEWAYPYWLVYETEELPEKVEKFLQNAGGYLIKHSGFDKVMYLLGKEFNYELPCIDDFLADPQERFNKLSSTYTDFMENAKINERAANKENMTSDPTIPTTLSDADSDLEHTYKKALMLNLNKKYSESLPLFEELVRKDSNNANYHYALGNTLKSLQQYEEALTHFRRAIQLEPTKATFYDSLSSAYYFLEHYDDALSYQEKAIELSPNVSLYYNALSLVLNKLGRYEDALNAITHAIEISPEESANYETLAIIYVLNDKLQEAIPQAQKAIQLDPEDDTYHDTLAWIYEKLGEYEAALPEAEKAVNLNPNNEINSTRLSSIQKKLNIEVEN